MRIRIDLTGGRSRRRRIKQLVRSSSHNNSNDSKIQEKVVNNKATSIKSKQSK